jgi:thioredoxin 1
MAGDTALMTGKVETYTDGNWDSDVLASQQPVLVDFWAEWCAPCRSLAPAIEAVAAQFQGRLKVGKFNVEENEHVPYKYNITTLPTLMIFKGGQVSEQRMGLLSKENLVKLIEPHLA